MGTTEIDDIKKNLEFLKQNYSNGKLENFIHEFGYSQKGLRLFSVIDQDFRQAIKEIKENIGYEGVAYSFSDYCGNDSIVDIEKDFGRFLGDVEKIINSKKPLIL